MTTSDEQQLELARRLVACPRFRWMPGMIALDGWRVDYADEYDVEWAGASAWRTRPPGEWLPDLRDPATRGCVLELIREAWGDWSVHIVPMAVDRFTVWSGIDGPTLDGDVETWPTEAAALVAALEAAPDHAENSSQTTTGTTA